MKINKKIISFIIISVLGLIIFFANFNSNDIADLPPCNSPEIDASQECMNTVEEGELTEEDRKNIERQNGKNPPGATTEEQGPQF